MEYIGLELMLSICDLIVSQQTYSSLNSLGSYATLVHDEFPRARKQVLSDYLLCYRRKNVDIYGLTGILDPLLIYSTVRKRHKENPE